MPQGQPLLALVGLDRQVYVQDLAVGARVSLTKDLAARYGKDAAFDWPCWSPNGELVAFTADGGDGQGLYIARPDGSVAHPLYRGDRPFYLAWSPDGRRIAFLAQAGQGLVLYAVTVEGSPKVSRLVEGSPSYLAWSRDSRELLVHLGGDRRRNPGAFLARVNVMTGEMQRTDLRPAEFRAASWSPDGERLAAAALEGDGCAVVTTDLQAHQTPLARFRGKAAFLWSPKGDQVAALLSNDPATQGYEAGLHVVDADGRDSRPVAEGELLAFFWSPDGSRLVYVGVDRGRNRLHLTGVNPDGSHRQRLSSFLPSQGYLFMLSFFDQYALSCSLWTAGGRGFLYAGKTFKEERNGGGLETEDSQFMVPTDGSAPPRHLGHGGFGVLQPG